LPAAEGIDDLDKEYARYVIEGMEGNGFLDA
jgi:hypothetical protein